MEQLRREVEESKLDQRRSNISQSDMQTSEILRLRQVKDLFAKSFLCTRQTCILSTTGDPIS